MGNQQQQTTQVKKVTATELQTYIMVVQAKLTQNRNKRVELIKRKRKEIVACLEDNNLDIAKAKMESLLREEDYITVFDILGPLCEILKEKVTYMLLNDKCPDDLRAPVDTIIYSSTRLEIDEMHKIRDLVGQRYGELYITKANSNTDLLVNVNVVDKLKIKPASDQYLIARLKQLCREEKIDFDFPQEIIAPCMDSFEPLKNPQGNTFEDQFKNYTDMGYNNPNMNYNQIGNPNFNQMGNPSSTQGMNYNSMENPNFQNPSGNYQQSFLPNQNFDQNQNFNQGYGGNNPSFNQNQNLNNNQNFNQGLGGNLNFNQNQNLNNNQNFSQSGSSGFGSNFSQHSSVNPNVNTGQFGKPTTNQNMNMNMNEFTTGGGPNSGSALHGTNPDNKGFPSRSVIMNPGPNMNTNLNSHHEELGSSYNNNSPTLSKTNFSNPYEINKHDDSFNVIKSNQSSYNPYRDDFQNPNQGQDNNISGSSFPRSSVQGKVYTNEQPSTPMGGEDLALPQVHKSTMGTVDELFPKPRNNNSDFPSTK